MRTVLLVALVLMFLSSSHAAITYDNCVANLDMVADPFGTTLHTIIYTPLDWYIAIWASIITWLYTLQDTGYFNQIFADTILFLYSAFALSLFWPWLLLLTLVESTFLSTNMGHVLEPSATEVVEEEPAP